MKTTLRTMILACAMAAGLAPAHAGVLTFQDVVFTTSWTRNVLTLEIDAARHSGDWTRATMLGALSLKDIGSFRSVSVTAAPQGAGEWRTTSKELNANGCAGGGGSRSTKAVCLSGTPIALTDNMVFSFTFSGGTPDLDEPHLKVSFLDASRGKVGDLLSQPIKSAPVVVAPPVTSPPVTSPPVTPVPVTPQPVTPPTTPPPVTPQPATPLPVTPPATAPVSGNTTVPATVENVAATTPPVNTGAMDPVPVPVPPPFVVTPPVLELEPVMADTGANEVPEPQSIAMLLSGLALMGLALRKRR